MFCLMLLKKGFAAAFDVGIGQPPATGATACVGGSIGMGDRVESAAGWVPPWSTMDGWVLESSAKPPLSRMHCPFHPSAENFLRTLSGFCASLRLLEFAS